MSTTPASAVYLVKRLQTALRAALDEAVTPAGLTLPELAVLATLRRSPGLSNAELARVALVKPQSMTPLLRSLEAKGLVARSPHPAGGRALPAELTPLGGARVEVGGQAAREVEDHMLSGLSVGDRAWFTAMLETCIASLKG